MSWQWPAQPAAATGMTGWPAAPAATTTTPGTQYTPDQWAAMNAMQQQNWQQWMNWQQQYQQWQQQYGEQYAKQMALAGQPVQPPYVPSVPTVPTVPTMPTVHTVPQVSLQPPLPVDVKVAPPLPQETKPPLPPDEAPKPPPDFSVPPPSTIQNKPPNNQNMYGRPNAPINYQTQGPQNYRGPTNTNQQGPRGPTLLNRPGASQGPPGPPGPRISGEGNFGGATRFNANQPPPSLLDINIKKPFDKSPRNQNFPENKPDFGNKRPGDFKDNFDNSKKNRWETDNEFQDQKQWNQDSYQQGDVQNKWPKGEQNQQKRWGQDFPNTGNQSKSWNQQSTPQSNASKDANKPWGQTPPSRNQSWPTNTNTSKPPPARSNAEELSEAEKLFDKQFEQWESQFNKWKDQNQNHPDKQQYKEYEAKWESWRTQLLDRREQMRKKRLGLSATPSSTAVKPPVFNNATPQINTPSPSQTPDNQQKDSKEALLPTPSPSVEIETKESTTEAKDPPQDDADISFLFSQPPKEQRKNIRSRRTSTKVEEPPTENVPTDTSFLQSANANANDGIPGLDLVKDEDKVEEESDKDDDKEDDKKSHPDFEAISKGINTILGDAKLMNMLSLVSQNKNPTTGTPPTSHTQSSAVQSSCNPTVPEDMNNSYQSNESFGNQNFPENQYNDSYSNDRFYEPSRDSGDFPPNQPNQQGGFQERSDFRGPQNFNRGNFNQEPPNRNSGEFFPPNRGNFDNNRGSNTNFNQPFNRGPNNFNRGPMDATGNNFETPPPNNFQRPPPNNFQGPPPNNFQGPPPNKFQGPPPNQFQGPPPNRGNEFNRSQNNQQSNHGQQQNDFNRPSFEFNRGSNWGPNNRGNFNDAPNRGSNDFNQQNRAPLGMPSRGPMDGPRNLDESRNFDGPRGNMDGSKGFNDGMGRGKDGPRGSMDATRGPVDGPGPRGIMDGPSPRGMMDGPSPRGMMDGSRGPMDGSRGPMDGPRGPMDGPRGLMDGPRKMMDGPRGPMDGPRGLMDGPRGPMDNPRGPMDGPRSLMDGSRGPMDGPRSLMDSSRGPVDGSRGPMDGPRGSMDGPRGPMDGPRGPMDGPRGPMDGPRGSMDGPRGPMDGPRGLMDSNRGFNEGQRDVMDNSRGFDNQRGQMNNRGPNNFNDGPRNLLDGPRGSFNNSQGSFDNTRGPFNNSRLPFDNTKGPMDNTRGMDGPRGMMDTTRPRGLMDTPINLMNRGPNDNLMRGPNDGIRGPSMNNRFNNGQSNVNPWMKNESSRENFNPAPLGFNNQTQNNRNDDMQHRNLGASSGPNRESQDYDDFRNKSNQFGNPMNERSFRGGDMFRGDFRENNSSNSRASTEKYWDEALILKPFTVIDYGHKSIKKKESTFMEPVQTFDYNHASKDADKPEHKTEKEYSRESSFNKNNRYSNSPSRSQNESQRSSHESPRSHELPRPPRINFEKNSFNKNKSFERNNYDDNRDSPVYNKDTCRFEPKRKAQSSKGDKFDQSDRSQKFDSNIEYDDIEDEDPFADDDMVESPSPSEREKNMEQFVNPSPNVPETKNSSVMMVEDLLIPPGRNSRPQRIVIMLRGPPGSGKTFLAKLIKDKEVEQGGSAPRILSLDDYFMVETDKEVIEKETGRKTTVKEMVYEYEECMELSYRQSLERAFKKTITDGFFPFIILDCVNDKVKHFSEMWSFAKQNGFQVYVCQMELDVTACTKRNIHHRSEIEIERLVAGWENTPSHYLTLDATSLIQAGSISEVEMEEVSTVSDEEDNDGEFEGHIISKWERMEPSGEKLAKLDGTNKPLRPKTMEDYLQMDDDIPEERPGVKTVRWADLEERRHQEKIRALGFVVGQTDWNRMLDPTQGSSALTQTKYIERVRRF